MWRNLCKTLTFWNGLCKPFYMKLPSHIFSLSKYSIVPAVAYCIPVLFFLKDNTFSQTWLLYLGNSLFLAGIFIIAVINNRITNSGSNISNNGFIISIIAIVISIIIIAILLAIYLPGPHGDIAHTATNIPASNRRSTGSLIFMLIANALIGNFVAGSFATLVARGSSEKDQVAK